MAGDDESQGRMTELMEVYENQTGDEPRDEEGELTEEYKKWRRNRSKDKEELSSRVKELEERIDELSEDFDDMSNYVEQTKVKAEALSNLRESYDSRFSNLNEKVGELRNSVVTGEKERAEIQSKADRAASLVEQIEPETILTEVNKKNAEIEALEGKIEALGDRMDNLLDQIKDTRQEVNKFSGVEEVLNRSEEIKDDLATARKIRTDVKSRADRVTAIFSELRGRLKEMGELKSDVETLKSNVEDMSEDMTELSVKVESIPDIEGLQERVATLGEKVRETREKVEEENED